MTTRPAAPLEIFYSARKVVALLAGGIALTLVSAAIAFRAIPDIEPESFEQFIGYAGVVFFGFCAIVALWRMLSTRGPVVSIDAYGIRDVRVASGVIPWSAVRDISTWEYSRQKAMVLKIDPEAEGTLGLTRTARWTRGANAALGADGLCVAPQGIAIDYDALLSTSLAFWNAQTGKGGES